MSEIKSDNSQTSLATSSTSSTTTSNSKRNVYSNSLQVNGATDHLGLSGNPKITKLLEKFRAEDKKHATKQLQQAQSALASLNATGSEQQRKVAASAVNKAQAKLTLASLPETVVFTDFLIKINKRDKEQSRTIMITNKALYNLKNFEFNAVKRRMPLTSLTAISISSVSDEFSIHVADEYDYRYKANKKFLIAEILSKVYKNVHQTLKSVDAGDNKEANLSIAARKLPMFLVNQVTLKERALTKTMAKHQTRDDIMKRKRLLAAQEHDSDREEEEEIRKYLANAKLSKRQLSVSLKKPVLPKLPDLPSQLNTEAPTVNPKQNVERKPSSSQVSESTGIVSILGNTSGVTLEDFELLRVLGRGSFGKVMQVRMKKSNKVYAMKILKKKSIIAKNQVEHTKAERNILQALSHPFLMTLRYAFQSPEKLYFVLDYYQGGELFFHLKQQRRFAEETVKIYVAEIACALGHLHGLGIIYRDLKPENILLDSKGHVCLTDFGLSKDINALVASNTGNNPAMTFCGTPEYLAPEIVTGNGHDKAVDWWSLGILLYELAVGIPPFYSQNVNEMYQKIREGPLRFPPFLTEPCKAIIGSLLHRDPQQRLGSKNDLLDIQQHHFFSNIDWSKLLRKEYDVAYKPKVRSVEDVSNFDATFTNEPVVDSMTEAVLNHQVQKHQVEQVSQKVFKDFSFNASLNAPTVVKQDIQ